MTTALNTGIPMSTLIMQVRTVFMIEELQGLKVSCSSGKFAERDLPDYSSRNFEERGFTIGIGGYLNETDHLPVRIIERGLYTVPWAQERLL